MEELIKRLLESLIKDTNDERLRWQIGTEEGEFYLNLGTHYISINKKNVNNHYFFLLYIVISERDKKIVHINQDDQTIFDMACKLYDLISNKLNTITEEDFLDLMESIKKNN